MGDFVFELFHFFKVLWLYLRKDVFFLVNYIFYLVYLSYLLFVSYYFLALLYLLLSVFLSMLESEVNSFYSNLFSNIIFEDFISILVPKSLSFD